MRLCNDSNINLKIALYFFEAHSVKYFELLKFSLSNFQKQTARQKHLTNKMDRANITTINQEYN